MTSLIQEIPAFQTSPEDVFVIHVCLCKTSNANHFSPRVVCVYAQNLDGSQSEKFSIEKYASRNQIPLEGIEDWYDDLEIYLLDDFNIFLKGKAGCTFIYWVEEGQELILDILKSRFEELNKEDSVKAFHIIPTSKRKSIQVLVKNIAEDSNVPYDLKLFIKKYNNEQIVLGFLNNGEESNCFDRKEFTKIASSVISKVAFFIKLIGEYSIEPTTSVVNVFAPIDLQNMRVVDIFKNLNLKSWLILIGLCAFWYGAGHWISTSLNSKEVDSLKKEKLESDNNLNKEKESFGKLNQVYLDSITSLQKEIVLKNDTIRHMKSPHK